ncbi:MAG TPA: energy transducer TonB [Steroidobacteraceae bacterium]|nr:energy transducer TonB [Steroidobacteraceae bacterium]
MVLLACCFAAAAASTAWAQTSSGAATNPRVLLPPDIASFYPAALRGTDTKGTVRVQVCIDDAGHITGTSVRESSGSGQLDRAALQVAQASRFQPGTRDGVPQQGCAVLPIVFKPDPTMPDPVVTKPEPVVVPPVVRFAPDVQDYYPAESQRRHEQGLVQVMTCFNTRGLVTSTSIQQSSGYTRLDDAALRFLKENRASPGTRDGVPQPDCMVLSVNFIRPTHK